MPKALTMSFKKLLDKNRRLFLSFPCFSVSLVTRSWRPQDTSCEPAPGRAPDAFSWRPGEAVGIFGLKACLATQLGDCCSQRRGTCQLSQIRTYRRSARPVSSTLPSSSWLAPGAVSKPPSGDTFQMKGAVTRPSGPEKNPKYAALSTGRTRAH